MKTSKKIIFFGVTILFCSLAYAATKLQTPICAEITLKCFTALKSAGQFGHALALGTSLVRQQAAEKGTKSTVLAIEIADVLSQLGQEKEAESMLLGIYRPIFPELDNAKNLTKAIVLNKLTGIYLDRKDYVQAAASSREEIAWRTLAGYPLNSLWIIAAHVNNATALSGLGKPCEAKVVLQYAKAAATESDEPELKNAVSAKVASLELELKGGCKTPAKR